MEILVNGQANIASSDDNVLIGQLLEYLRGEFGKQRLVARSFVLDGQEIFPDGDDPVLQQTPENFKRLEVNVVGVEVVSYDVLDELGSNMPELSKHAVKVTEMLQTGESTQAGQELEKLNASIFYVINAISSIKQLMGIDLSALSDDDMNVDEFLKNFAKDLQELTQSLKDEDFTMTGDVLEFDLAPQIESLGTLIYRIRDKIREELEENQEAEESLSTPDKDS